MSDFRITNNRQNTEEKTSKIEFLHQRVNDVQERLTEVSDQTGKKFSVVKENIAKIQKQIEDEKQKKALIKKCQKTAADYNFQKLSENYRNFIQLVKDDGDWDLITQNFNNSVLHAESSQKYYKILRDYKKLKKIKRVQRKLKSYKKSLGIQ